MLSLEFTRLEMIFHFPNPNSLIGFISILAMLIERPRTFAGKESDRQKVLFDRKSKDLRLEPGDIVLVRKTTWQARHKIQNKWEDDDYVVISQQNPEIPVYWVRNVVSGQEKTLHRNLLLPLGFNFHATTYEEDEEFEIVLPLVRELEGEDHLDLDDGTAQPVKDSDPSILIPRQPSGEIPRSASSHRGFNSKLWRGLWLWCSF